MVESTNVSKATAVPHDLLHFYSNIACSHCRTTKQRRNYSKPVPENRRNLAEKPFQKTDIDAIIMGNNIPGIYGERVGHVIRDEHTGYVSFVASKQRDTPSTTDACLHHFAQEIDKAQSRGFLLYGDSAPEYKKVCKKIGILYRPATPNSDESNARHERFMGVFGDLIRNVLHQSGLPLMFWVFAAMFAANVYNMTITPFKKSKTPYAARYPRRHLPNNIAHFGQLVTYVPKDIEKHTSRSRQGIFVGYSQLPGGVVTDEYRLIPLSCFTQGLKTINVITSRDVRFSSEPIFQIRLWNDLSEGRKYIEHFKPLYGESYYKHIWENLDKHAIHQDPAPINVFEEGNIVEHNQDEEEVDEDEVEVDEPLKSGPESVGEPQGPQPPQMKPEVKKALERAEKDRLKRVKDAEFFQRKKAGTYEPTPKPVQTPSSSSASSSKGSPITATPAKVGTAEGQKNHSKVLLEFACGDDSLIGKRGPRKGVVVHRLTLTTCNLMTKEGLQHAIKLVRQNPGCSIHASIPCSPWSSWVKMNLHKLGKPFRIKLLKKREESLLLLHHFKIVAREVIQNGGSASFEWPRYCTGWQLKELTSFLSKFGFQKVDFDGCAFGLKSKKGNFIKKPWTIATTSSRLINTLFTRKCDRSHTHQSCEGNEAKRSAFYTESLADAIIDGLCWAKPLKKAPKQPLRQSKDPAVVSTVPAVRRGGQCHQDANPKQHDIVNTLSRQIDKVVKKAEAKLACLQSSVQVTEAFNDKVNEHFIDDKCVERQLLHRQLEQLQKSLSPQQKQSSHREKITFSPLNIMGLVTKILTKKDNEYYSQGAKDAVKAEVSRLINATVWDTKPLSRHDAVRLHPDATFSRLFGILGIKDYEANTAKYKYRVVVQGSNMKDINNNDVFFADTSNAPTNMACIRSVIAFSQASGGEVSQADAEQAYIQPFLEESVHIYITIPEEMWNDDMKQQAKGINNPVFRLRRPLYGWSRSGNIWEEHLDTQLKSIEHDGQNGDSKWKSVPDWPQTFWKIGALKKPIVLTVYVDDFILGGPGSSREWPSIQKVVKISEPGPVGRVLGVHHHFQKQGTVTSTEIEMNGYLQQSVDLYNSLEGSKIHPLKNNVFYPWYEPTQHEIDTLGVQEGIFGPNSASLLMKALYSGRMVRLDICYAINTLSKYITKWSALCDKQIKHLFSYLLTTKERSLHGIVDSRDLELLVLKAYPDADLAGTFDTSRATSGGFVELAGLNTMFPLDWYSKRQTATAHSTSEAELISASKMLREHLVPLQSLWSIMLGRPIHVIIHEDNESTIAVIKNGYSPQLRYLAKHHRISLGLVHELCQNDDIDIVHIETAKQKGDLLTKGLARPKHEPALQLVGVYPLIAPWL